MGETCDKAVAGVHVTTSRGSTCGLKTCRLRTTQTQKGFTAAKEHTLATPEISLRAQAAVVQANTQHPNLECIPNLACAVHNNKSPSAGMYASSHCSCCLSDKPPLKVVGDKAQCSIT